MPTSPRPGVKVYGLVVPNRPDQQHGGGGADDVLTNLDPGENLALRDEPLLTTRRHYVRIGNRQATPTSPF